MTRPLAAYYLMHATLFRQAAEVLHEDFSIDGKQFEGNIKSIPFMHLMLHAIELLLKACLLKRSYPEDKLLKPALRHNLAGLLNELEKSGRTISQSTRRVVGSASDLHQKHLFRYEILVTGSNELIQATELYCAFDELMDAAALSSGDGATYLARMARGKSKP